MKQFRSTVKQALLGVAAVAILCGAGLTPGRADGVLADAVHQLAPARVAVQDEAQRLHVVLLGYTPAGRFGTSCAQDVAVVRDKLTQTFDQPGRRERLQIHDLTGNDYTPGRVLDYLRALEVQPTDNVLVFHSGHGRMLPDHRPGTPDERHVLLLNTGEVRRADLRRVLEEKGPRAVILLTDCCSSYDDRPLQAQTAAGIKAPGEMLNWSTIRQLFLRPRGLVDVTAAEDGTTAQIAPDSPWWNYGGSYFTIALMKLLSDPQQSFTSWNEFFPHLRDRTAEVSRRQHRARAFSIREQRLPEAWVAGQ